MAEEVKHNYTTGLALYFCRFLANSNVMLANPATNEVWGTDGRDADDYDVPMTEEGGSGHYTGDFASGGTIGAGTYHITVYNRATGTPIDSDIPLAQGQIYWSGSAELDLYTILAKLPDEFFMGSSVQTSMDDEINTMVAALGQVHTTEDESPGGSGGAPGTTSGIAEGC